MSRVGPIRAARVAGHPVLNVVFPYHVTGPYGSAWGVLCLADATEPAGTEDTDPLVVARWAARLTRTRTLNDATLLVPAADEDELTARLRDVVADREPATSTVDALGQRHRLWTLGPGAARNAILRIADRHPLIVADGNHRTAAIRRAALPTQLALVTAGPDLRIGPIHRELVGTGLDATDLATAWSDADLTVSRTGHPAAYPGEVTAITADTALRVRLPPPHPDEPLPRIDHAAVEDILLRQALDLDPAGPAVHPLPMDHTTAQGEAVLLIAPVGFDDLLAVHRQGRRMPRKSSCFVPKPHPGLVDARLD